MHLVFSRHLTVNPVPEGQPLPPGSVHWRLDLKGKKHQFRLASSQIAWWSRIPHAPAGTWPWKTRFNLIFPWQRGHHLRGWNRAQ